MNTLDIDVNEFTSDHPTEEGKYLMLMGLSFSIITVYRTEPEWDFGIHWDSILAVAEYRGRNVTQLTAKFIKLKF